MKVTIITACFNSEKTIANTFDSILNQSGQDIDIEYIVVDGASTDSTLAIVSNYESKFIKEGIDLKWISGKDNGIYNAWNKGLKLASGEWISFLGSDDLYLKGALNEFKKEINQNPSADFITAKAKMVRDGNLIREFGEAWNWKTFQREMKILHAGGFLNKKYLDEFGSFDESYRITGDYELLLRKKQELNVVFVDLFLVEMGADGVSSEQVWPALKEAKRARIKTGGVNVIVGTLQLFFVYFKIKLKQLLF